MKAGKGGLAIGVVLMVPLSLLFSVGDDPNPVPVGVGLDIKLVPPQYVAWVQKAGKTCPLITAPVVAAQIDAESGWNPTAVSPVGAEGLSQFMPGTWSAVGMDVASKDGTPRPDGTADPFTPGDAIMTQAKYDCDLAKNMEKLVKAGKVRGDLLNLTLAAYNAGSGAVEKAGGIPNIVETQGYVQSIRLLIAQYSIGDSGTGTESSVFGAKVLAEAKKWEGTPYSWGGGGISGPTDGGSGTVGFDCSSLVLRSVYIASGGKTVLPRVSQEQALAGTPVQPKDIKVGDVIAFALHGAGDYDHIGIYAGNHMMIHAPKTGDVVKFTDLRDAYYTSVPQVIRRFG